MKAIDWKFEQVTRVLEYKVIAFVRELICFIIFPTSSICMFGQYLPGFVEPGYSDDGCLTIGAVFEVVIFGDS